MKIDVVSAKCCDRLFCFLVILIGSVELQNVVVSKTVSARNYAFIMTNRYAV